jgi:hypothetical protein
MWSLLWPFIDHFYYTRGDNNSYSYVVIMQKIDPFNTGVKQTTRQEKKMISKFLKSMNDP